MECTACDAGTFKASTGAGACSLCQAGTFQNTTGAGACSVCPAASTSAAGAASVSECDACLPNHGAFPLCICPSGTYRDATGDTCVSCPGSLSSASGSLSVGDCMNSNTVLQEHPASGIYTASAFDAGTLQDLSGHGRDATVMAGTVSLRTASGHGASAAVVALAGSNSDEHPASAIYSAAAFDAGTLQDLSGHGRDATVTAGTVSRRTASGHGTSADVVALAGDTSAKVLWPVGSIPATFTVCSVTRYDDLGGSRFKTNQVNVGTATDWLVMCGTSDAGVPAPGNIVLDQDEIGIANGGAGPCQLAINYDQPSDWLVHSLLIWDSGLSTATMKQVTAALREALDSGEDLVYSDVCTDGLACVCGVGTYYDPSEPSRCHNCPGASTSAAGATSVAACDCLPNHGSFPFCICSSGTYLNATRGLSSSSGSLSVADCVMNSNAVLQEHPASAIYSAAAFDAGTLQDL
ncbi:hypothetical protein T484DRAFT_1763176, partial [Baffinella frigidus]